MPARAEYRALRSIQANGVWAYHAGDDVYASAVDNLGLVIGEDVEPSGHQLLAKPARNASRAAWAAYAVDQGIPVDEIEPMGRDMLIELFEEKETP